jgi:hypothetical protein
MKGACMCDTEGATVGHCDLKQVLERTWWGVDSVSTMRLTLHLWHLPFNTTFFHACNAFNTSIIVHLRKHHHFSTLGETHFFTLCDHGWLHGLIELPCVAWACLPQYEWCYIQNCHVAVNFLRTMKLAICWELSFDHLTINCLTFSILLCQSNDHLILKHHHIGLVKSQW